MGFPFGQQGGPDVPGGFVAATAFLIATLTGMVAAITALVKAWGGRRTSNAAPVDRESVGEAQTRILREAIEALADAMEEAATFRTERDEARAEAGHWRDRYVRLLEEGRP